MSMIELFDAAIQTQSILDEPVTIYPMPIQNKVLCFHKHYTYVLNAHPLCITFNARGCDPIPFDHTNFECFLLAHPQHKEKPGVTSHGILCLEHYFRRECYGQYLSGTRSLFREYHFCIRRGSQGYEIFAMTPNSDYDATLPEDIASFIVSGGLYLTGNQWDYTDQGILGVTLKGRTINMWTPSATNYQGLKTNGQDLYEYIISQGGCSQC